MKGKKKATVEVPLANGRTVTMHGWTHPDANGFTAVRPDDSAANVWWSLLNRKGYSFNVYRTVDEALERAMDLPEELHDLPRAA